MTELDRNNLTPLTVFDYVHACLYEQGYASTDKNGSCVYRGPNNTKCAAGWLLPDANYSSSLERKPVENIWSLMNLPNTYKPLVIELQNMHDEILLKDVKMWRTAMNSLREVLCAYATDTV